MLESFVGLMPIQLTLVCLGPKKDRERQRDKLFCLLCNCSTSKITSFIAFTNL